EVLLLTDIHVPQDAKGSVTLAAKVSYLVCKDICVPETADVQLTLPVANEAEPSASAPQIASARSALPEPLPVSATYAVNPAKGALRLTAMAPPALLEGVTGVRFYPLTWGPVSNSAAQAHAISGGKLTLDLRQGDTKETPEKLEGLLVLTKGTEEGSHKA